jgi:hypothetical protein
MRKPLRFKRVAVFLVALCALSPGAGLQAGSASAQEFGTTSTASTEPSAPARVDAGKGTSTRKTARKGANGGRYYVEFRSRYALSYGHTFTMFGRLDARGEIATKEVAGLHPAGGPEMWSLGHVVPVPAETGPSDGDLEDEYMSARFRVELSEADYNRLVAHVRQKQKNSPTWHAVLNNCNLWTGEIAQFMGLKTPFHWLPPQEFINGIKDLNSGQPQAAYSSAAEHR